MPHELQATDTMVSAGGMEKAPWHYSETQDRTRIYEGQSIPGDKILELAGLDWEVEAGQMYFKAADGTMVEAPDHFATYRKDTSKFLGVVSDQYQVIQNTMVRNTLSQIVDDSHAAFETAGSLRGNRVVWFLMKMPEHVEIAGMKDERLDLYLLGKTGHGGLYGRDLMAFQICPTTVRVVCNNTLTWALSGARNIWTYRHVGDVAGKIQEAREAIQMSFKFQESIAQMANDLVQKPYTERELTEFLTKLFWVRKSKDAEQTRKGQVWSANKKQDFLQTLISVPDLQPIRDTQYGLLQAASAYDTHRRVYRDSPEMSAGERRFETVMGLGTQDNLATRAAKILTSTKFGSTRLDADIAEAMRGFDDAPETEAV